MLGPLAPLRCLAALALGAVALGAVALGAVALGAVALGAVADDPTIDFSSLGTAAIAAADAKRAPADAVKADADARTRFLQQILPLEHRIRLGPLELWVPKESLRAPGEAGRATPLAAIQGHAASVLKVVRAWMERTDLDGKLSEEGKKALAALEAWVKSWKASAVGATTPEVEAALAVAAAPFAKDLPMPVLLVAPTRTDFASLIGVAGIVDPAERPRLWVPSARLSTSWNLLWRVNAAALAWGSSAESGPPLAGNDMPSQESAQEIDHQASHLLSGLWLPDAPGWLREGLAIADTVAINRVDETRCSGDSAGAATAGRGGFQPGQIGDNVLVPGMSAEKSPFRRGPSAHYFVKELHRARSEEGFRLIDFDSGKLFAVKGPFLLPQDKLPAAVSSGSDGLRAGFAEFFRAYAAAFVHYFGDLKHEKKPLLAAVIQDARARSVSFHDALQSVTGKTLGSSDPEARPKDDWEAAFVEFLERGG
jgi:hypothetical protein